MSYPFVYLYSETLAIVRRRLKIEAMALLEAAPIPEDLRDDLLFEVLIFRSNLPPHQPVAPHRESPVLPRVLGTYQPSPHRIGISDALLSGDREPLLQEVLRHELAHLCAWVVDNAEGHGAAFHRWCDVFDIPRRAQCPVDERGEQETLKQQRVALRVRKLFALAESPHREEATEALRKANELIQRYNLSLIPEDSATPGAEELTGVELWRGGNTPVEIKLISSILGDYFWVYPLLEREHGATVLMCYGSAGATEVASYVFTYLLRVSRDLWKQYRRENGTAGKRRERISFYVGLFRGFRTTLAPSKLPGERTTATTAAEVTIAHRDALGTMVRELVWDSSADFHQRRGGITYQPGSAYAAGTDMGNKLSLHPGLRQGTDQPPRLLSRPD